MTTSNQMSDKIVSGVNEATGFASRTLDNAASGAHNAVDRAASAATPAVENIASSAHSAIDKASEVANKTAQALNVTGEQIRDAQTRFSDVCKGQMKENPVITLGVAVAAGFVLSRLLSAR